MSRGNLEKTITAPVTVIVGYDEELYEKLPYLFPHNDPRALFTSSPALAHETAFRNSSLPGWRFGGDDKPRSVRFGQR